MSRAFTKYVSVYVVMDAKSKHAETRQPMAFTEIRSALTHAKWMRTVGCHSPTIKTMIMTLGGRMLATQVNQLAPTRTIKRAEPAWGPPPTSWLHFYQGVTFDAALV